MTIDRGDGKTVTRSFTRAGGMCPRCEGRGSVSDIDLAQLYDASKSLNEGAITAPGYQGGGWNSRLYSESGFCDPDKPIGKFTKTELHDFLYREPTRMKIAGVNMTYLGLVGRIQRPMLSKEINIAEVCAMQISEPRRGSSSPIATHAAQPHTRSSSGWLTSGWAT